jgi:hypothetical protein
MKWRERAIEAAVGGVTGLLVTLLFIVLRRVGVTAGEWLQFAGVFLGVAATILGTLWLQMQLGVRKRRQQIQNIADALDLVSKLLGEIISHPHDQAVPRVTALENAFDHVVWARNQFDSCTYRVHASFAVLIDLWELDKKALLKEAQLATMYTTEKAAVLIDKAKFLLEAAEGARRVVSASDADENAWRVGNNPTT